MITNVATEPTPAERARTMCATDHPTVLVADGTDPVATTLHILDGSSLLVGVDIDSALVQQAFANPGLPAMVEINDLAPIGLRERTRALVWLRGRLHPSYDQPETVAELARTNPLPALLDVGTDSCLLRLEIDSVVLADSQGAAAITPDDLADAHPDPFAGFECEWIRHLEDDHPELVTQLVRRLVGRFPSHDLRILAIDRYGVRIRAEHEELPDADVRLAFSHPANDPAQLQQALRALIGCPFLH